MAAVAEIFLSPILKGLLTQLATGNLQSFVKEVGVGPKLKKWENLLKMIQAVIEDAEAKQVTRSAVKAWLAEVQDLAYEMEDILDEFATKALGRKLKAEQPGISAGKVLNKIPDVKLNFRMWSKMKSITTQLKELSNRVTALGLMPGEPSTSAYKIPPSAGLKPPGADVYGRDDDKAQILKMMGDAAGETSFSVISVIGMGGIGKTTLARDVYEDKSVEKHVKAWIPVHEDFDVLRISKAILSSVRSSSTSTSDWGLNQVLVELKRELTRKLFLLVLDDVWSRRDDLSAFWESLTSAFTDVARGSGIIVTTRHHEVASVTGSYQHVLELLSNENCLSVFMTHAPDNIRTHHNLKQIQEKVVERCKGLPLAAKALGNLLRSLNEYEWEKILNSNLWNKFDEEGGVLPVLRLSYYHLPSHLKRCFAYCAIFPKGFEFEEEELVLLWMAEGLIQLEKNAQPEELGRKYFHDLLSMSLFQQSSYNGSKFVMHDLINDLAQWISGETTLTLEHETRTYGQSRSFDSALHLFYSSNYCDRKNRFEKYHEAKRLRTLLATASVGRTYYLSNEVLPSLLPKLKKLRVLSLQTYRISQLPNSIASLRHLRYLNFSGTTIRNLPESISTLYNLQILMLRLCRHLKMLPSKIENLVGLRHLNIKGTYLIKHMPSGMNKLECLQTLSNFIVGKSNGSNLKDLKNLKFITGELHISRLENTYNSNEENGNNVDQDITEAVLVDKQFLEVLILEWGNQFDVSRNEIAEKYVLDMLKPHGNLKKLTIKSYAGRNFPSWVGDPRSLSNLTVLRLERCAMCASLPTLGLLGSLKHLSIRGMRALKQIGSEIYGEGCSVPFKSLETLYFEDLKEWEHWDTINENQHIQIFPSLCELSIVDCPKLLAIPPDPLPSLQNLVIRKCPQLTISIYGLPSLRKLKVKDCLGLVISARSLPMLNELKISECRRMVFNSPIDFTSLKSLILSNISASKNWFMQEFVTVECFEIGSCEELMTFGQPLSSLTSLRELCIRDFSSFVSFPDAHFFSFLNKLEIKDCPTLRSLPEGIKHINARLEHLEILNCDSLKFIFRDQLPLSLKTVVVKECKELRCLFSDRKDTGTSSALHNKSTSNTNTSLLEKLDVVNCDSLRCLSSKGQLPVTLKHLSIDSCWTLTTLSSDPLPTALTHLSVHSCWELTTLSSYPLPTALTHLSVHSCWELTTLSSYPLPTALTHLSVDGCSALTTLSSDPLPTALTHLSVEHCRELTTLSCQLPLTLEHLKINKCSKLATIAQMFHTNSSIESISIRKCENLASLPDGLHKLSRLRSISIISCDSLVSFPEGGLPDTNLIDCSISYCRKLKALPNWMHRLNSLQRLSIGGCPALKSCPEEGFPTQLKELDIQNFWMYKLAFIQRGLHKLAFLTKLDIWGCADAESFPQEEMGMMLPTSLTDLTIVDFPKLKKLCSKGFQNLSSLECLTISNCPNLKSFPKAGLPSSLLQLYVSRCPLLTERYVGVDKEKWSKMAHIPLGSPLLKERYKRVQRKRQSDIAHIPLCAIDHKLIQNFEEE